MCMMGDREGTLVDGERCGAQTNEADTKEAHEIDDLDAGDGVEDQGEQEECGLARPINSEW